MLGQRKKAATADGGAAHPCRPKAGAHSQSPEDGLHWAVTDRAIDPAPATSHALVNIDQLLRFPPFLCSKCQDRVTQSHQAIASELLRHSHYHRLVHGGFAACHGFLFHHFFRHGHFLHAQGLLVTRRPACPRRCHSSINMTKTASVERAGQTLPTEPTVQPTPSVETAAVDANNKESLRRRGFLDQAISCRPVKIDQIFSISVFRVFHRQSTRRGNRHQLLVWYLREFRRPRAELPLFA